VKVAKKKGLEVLPGLTGQRYLSGKGVLARET